MINEILKTQFITEKELQEAKDKILGQYILSQETNLEKATSKAWYEATGRGFDYFVKYEKLLEQVTVSDVLDVANKIFTENYVKVVVD